MKTGLRVFASSVWFLVLYCMVVFVPAWTISYWQGWAYIAVATTATIISTAYLARTNPAALQRRMQGGPRAESRTTQKILVTAVVVSTLGVMAFSAFDHRMGWSSVPAWVSVVGDALVAAGLAIASLVVVQNAYAAATVRVEEGQRLATDGVYKRVRHPMYIGALIMMLGVPLALGSYWGLLFVPLSVLVFALRILDEERMLTQELGGYREYTQQVRYRLVPHVW